MAKRTRLETKSDVIKVKRTQFGVFMIKETPNGFIVTADGTQISGPNTNLKLIQAGFEAVSAD